MRMHQLLTLQNKKYTKIAISPRIEDISQSLLAAIILNVTLALDLKLSTSSLKDFYKELFQ